MKILLMVLLVVMCVSQSWAYPVTAPEGKTLKVHWAVLQAKPGKMGEMAAISARTVAKYTPNEKGSYALYGAIDSDNPDLMRILEVYEDEAAYQVHRDSECFKAFISEREPILESLKILSVAPIILEQKEEGTAKSVSMVLIEVKPECVEEFKALTAEEFARAVREDEGVMAMFATVELDDRANFVHMLEMFKNDVARERYFASEKFNAFNEKAAGLVKSVKVITNKPANITLNTKGLHLEHGAHTLSVFPLGEKNEAFAQYFDGQSYLAPMSLEQVSIFNVTFEPGCRNHWHIHHAKTGGGQILVAVSGRGYYQEWGKPAIELNPGDVVNIPANVKHVHGAARDSWFQHLAVEVPGEETSNEWCEPVDPEEYAKLK